jgi:hypothetical protein
MECSRKEHESLNHTITDDIITDTLKKGVITTGRL